MPMVPAEDGHSTIPTFPDLGTTLVTVDGLGILTMACLGVAIARKPIRGGRRGMAHLASKLQAGTVDIEGQRHPYLPRLQVHTLLG